MDKERAMDNVDIERPRRTDPDPDRVLWPAWVNLLVGVWLVITAFAWPHAAATQTNTWVVGALIAVSALWAMFVPAIRYVDTFLATWLFFSAIGFAGNTTPWHDVIAAIVVFLVSLVPTGTITRTGGRPIHA
jgi:hypothetical protein